MLLLAVLLPALLWDKGPETAAQLKSAGIAEIAVAPSSATAWKGVADLSIRSVEVGGFTKLPAPTVQYRMNEAGATRSPWIDSNGWRFFREPKGHFIYDAPGPAAALAAAEAFAYGADAVIRTDAAGLEPLGKMLAFLRTIPPADMPSVADISFTDDGSPQAGEVMNLMVRRNLLFQTSGNSGLKVQLGSEKYPKETAANPSAVAQQVRFELTDEKRSLRIYGSQVVIGRMTGDASHRRVHLLNYSSASRPVSGVRIRVLGRYPQHTVTVADAPDAKLIDFEVQKDATEFTIAEIKSIAVIDLSR